MHISDAELGMVSTTAGLVVGSSTSGSVTVNAVTDGNSDAFATLTLIATGASKSVTFSGHWSQTSEFNQGIVVQSFTGISMMQGVTTKSAATVLDAGTGVLHISTGMVLSTTG